MNTLDLVLSSQLEIETTVREGIFESDHAEVICLLKSVGADVPLVTRSAGYNYKAADFDGLRQCLRLLPWTVLDDMGVDEAVDVFYQLLDSAIKDHIPMVSVKRKFPPWFDRELRGVLKGKECAFRRMKRNRTPETEARFRDHREQFKTLSRMKYSDYLLGMSYDFKTNPKRFWSFLSCLKLGKKGMSVLCDGGMEIVGDRERANLLNRYLLSQPVEP